jgi:hypothetical protein
MVAENSPYFESGAKMTYTSDNNNLSLSAMALNGWQRITRVNGNSLISWGTQIIVKPTDKLIVNYSTFFGTDKPDSVRLWRIYHILYTILQINDKVGLTVGFDTGTEQVSKGSRDKNIWYTPVLFVLHQMIVGLLLLEQNISVMKMELLYHRVLLPVLEH